MNVKRILCLLLPLCFLLCSCSGTGDTADTADGQLTYYYTEEYKDDMVEKIERYNRWCINHSTEDMKIKLIKFDNYETMSQRLNIEVMAGGGPDLYSNYMDLPFEQLMKNDSFCDLNELIENDTSSDKLDLSKYNKTVMDAGVYNGKRYFIPAFYRVHTLVGEKELLEKFDLPTEQGFHLTFDNMDEVFSKYLEDPGDIRFLSGDERNGALDADAVMLRLVNSQVSFQNKSVGFDNEDFRNKLETLEQLREHSDTSDSEAEKVAEADSKYLFNPHNSYSNPIWLEIMMTLSDEFGGEYKVNDPVLYSCFEKDEDTYSAGIVDAIFVKKGCKKSDKVLAFIKYLLGEHIQNLYTGTSEEYSYGGDVDYLPVLDSALDNIVKDAGNILERFEMYIDTSGKKGGLHPITQSLIDNIRKINSVELYFDLYKSSYDKNVAVPILQDYWDGIIDAKKCADRLSSATKIYIGE